MTRKFEDIKPNRDLKFVPKKEEEVTSRIYKPDIVIEKEIKEEIFFFKKKNEPVKRLPSSPIRRKKKRILSGYIIAVLFIALILGTIYIYSTYFQKANITITKKHQEIVFKNKQFLAGKNNGDNIDFEIMITSDKKLKEIFLTEGEEASSKAKGSITLYNEFSQTVERIPAGTFVSDPDGKTYKTDQAVVIPGYKLDNTKKIIPGNIEVKITSFLPGESYNGNPLYFNITPFKGTAKYKKIYGKLKTPLTGGALGQVYKLDELSKEKLNKLASESFKNDLFKKVKALIPPGFVLYNEAGTFKYSFDENFISKTPEAQIELEGELAVILLAEKSLEENIKKISLNELSSEELNEISVPEVKNLIFSFVDENQTITKELEEVKFYLNGNFDAIWNPNSETIKNKLLGINKGDVMSIFRSDPGIASAIVKLTPPWIKYLPNKPSKIEIITQ